MILRTLSLIDVDADPEPLCDLPVFVSQGFCTTQIPTINPVRSPEPMFNAIGAPTRECLRKFTDDISTLLRVNGFNPSPAQELIQGHSNVVTCPLIEEGSLSIRCGRIQDLRNRVHHPLHLMLGLLEGKFCRLLSNRFEHDSAKRNRLSGVIVASGNAGVKPSVLPVGAHQSIDSAISNAFREQSIPMT